MFSLKARSYRLLGVLYETIFKEKMGYETQKFFIGTSYAAIGILSGALLTFIFNILAARTLGPDNFGNLSLISTVGGILILSMTFSNTATVKYAAGAKDDSVRIRIISTSAIQIALFAALSVGIYVFLAPQLSHVFGISGTIFFFSVVFAVAVTLFGATTNYLRILSRMRAYALSNALQSVIVLAVFLVFVSNNMRSLQSAVFAIYISYTTIGLILVLYVRNYIKLQFDWFWTKKIVKYSSFAFPGAIAGAFMGVDKLLINTFMTTVDVGIYSAYFLPSMTIALMLSGIINATFFPYASRSGDRQTLLRKINKVAPYIALLFIPLIVLLETIVFLFYGRQYPFSLGLSFLFAIASAFFLLFQCYGSLTGSVGTSGAKVVAIGSILAFFVLVGLDVALIPRIGISGAAITLIFAWLIPSFFLFSKRRVLSGSPKRY